MEPFTAEGVLERLRASGLRVTKPRQFILAALFAAREPITLPDLRARAGEFGEAPDQATVFRVVMLLEKLGIVSRVNLRHPSSHFELRDPSRHHNHLVCTACGKIVPLPFACPLAEIERRVTEELGFSEVGHSVEFFGRCAECGNPDSRQNLQN